MGAREQLLEACVAELVAGGAASVKSIAARAGVNHGLVHHYFGSKEALLVEALRWHDAALGREATTLTSQQDYRRFCKERLLADPRSLALWVALLTRTSDLPELQNELRRRLDQRAGVLQEVLGLGSTRDAKLLMAAALGAALLHGTDPETDPQAIIGALVDIDAP